MMAGIMGPRLQIQGERQSGQDVRTQNVMAVSAVANIVKTSLGPVGLDKVGGARGPAGWARAPGGLITRARRPRRCWWTSWAM